MITTTCVVRIDCVYSSLFSYHPSVLSTYPRSHIFYQQCAHCRGAQGGGTPDMRCHASKGSLYREEIKVHNVGNQGAAVMSRAREIHDQTTQHESEASHYQSWSQRSAAVRVVAQRQVYIFQ